MHCSGLVGIIVDGASVIENCEVSATVSSSRSHFGGFIGHSVSNAVTLRGCVFSGSLSGGTYVATFHGWSDDGATTTLIDCLDASGSDQPIGRGNDAACVSNTYYFASKDFSNGERLWGATRRGKRANAVTEGTGVTIDFGTTAATYGTTDITAYPAGMVHNDTFYAGQGDVVRLDLAATPPSGMVLDAYVASAGTLSQSGNAWTLEMPDGPVVVSANWTAIPRGEVQLWAGGPYWAETNVGADEPWDYGYYFWWGDTVGYRRENDAWVASDGSTSNFSFEEGNAPTYGKDTDTLRSEGWITADDVLAPAHDAARAHLGAPWRMPTYQEIYDLCYTYCDWTWTTTNGVMGYVVRGRGDFADASIFLPAAGFGDRNHLYDVNSVASWGHYWSSVPVTSSSAARDLYLSKDTYYSLVSRRCYGRSVRPVFPAPIDLSALTADFTAEDGEVLTGETTYNVTIPAGARVMVNGVPVTGGGTVNPAPAFSSGCEAVTTKFEQGAGDTWVITAFAELANDAVGADVPDDAITVYRGDAVDGITNAVAPTVTRKSSAVKVEMTVDAPPSAPAQFFRVGFGE